MERRTGEMAENQEVASAKQGRPRTGGGGKLARSETVTVRLDPKLRYLAELAARKQRRTVSSFIEWAIEESLNRVIIYEDPSGGPDRRSSIASESSNLWDVDEPDRFAKLALRYPELLTHEEQVLWKLVRENGHLWLGRYTGPSDEWTWRIDEDSLRFDELRVQWPMSIKVAKGEAPRSALPAWVKEKPDSSSTASAGNLDDEIPF
jgi:hypothetical protein